MVVRVSAMMKNCGITAGVVGASALLLGGCAAGKYNPAAQTWQISPQHNGVVINNFAAIYPDSAQRDDAKTTREVPFQFSIANQTPNSVVSVLSITPTDGTGTVELDNTDLSIEGDQALFSPHAPSQVAVDHPLGVKAVLTDDTAKLQPGLTVPVKFSFMKTTHVFEGSEMKNVSEKFSIDVAVPVKLDADVDHSFQQENFSHVDSEPKNNPHVI